MELYEAMRTAVTTRLFTGDDVDDEVLTRVLDNARFAPNGGNRQGWHVVVVRDRSTRLELARLYREPFEQYMRERYGRTIPDEPELPVDVFAARLGEIPVHLVFCALVESLALTDASLDRVSIVGGASIYPFAQNVLLGLRAEGLGAAMTTMVVVHEPAVVELLGIPPGYAVACHVLVGVRADPFPTKLTRAPVAEFTSLDRWGATYTP